MQKLIFAILFSFSFTAQAIEVAGYFINEKSKSFLVTTHGKMPIHAVTAESKQVLNRLISTDFIYGSGEIINNEVFLTNIDIVGLRNLLGLWTSSRHLIDLEFLNFTHVAFHNQDIQTSRNQKPKLLNYVVTPGADSNTWRVLFADENSVRLASLSLDLMHAYLEFFDEKTGEVVDRIILKRK